MGIDLINHIIEFLANVEWINIMPLYSTLLRIKKKMNVKINCELIRLHSES